MRGLRILVHFVGLAVFLAGAGRAAQPDDPTLTRARSVSGWVVSDLAESDGGNIVRLTRRGRDFRIEYEAVFWRGNYGPIRGLMLTHGACRSGDAGTGMPDGWIETEAWLRARLVEHLTECRVRPARRERLLAGLGPAFALFASWVAAADAAVDAENRAIFNEGAGPEPRS